LTRNLHISGEARVVEVRKFTKSGDKGATMMYVGNCEQEGDSIIVWDPSTARVIVT